MKASPLPYQERSIKAIEQFRGRCLLAHEMGLGKTLISLWWWQRHPEAHPGLVVCPASVKWVWEHEALRQLGVRPWVIEGTKPNRSRPIGAKPELVIINYDVLHHWADRLKQMGFRSLFVDECHYIKSSTAKRTKAVRAMAKAAKHVVAISGTPLLSRPIELFTTLQMLRPTVFPSRWAYAHEYCKPRWTPWGWTYDGACRLPELHDLLRQTCMVRYLKRDVLPELPEKVRRVLPLALSDEGEYMEARDSFLSWMGRRDPARLLRAAKAETLVKLGELKRLAARLKLRSVVEWTNEWLENYPEEKLVMFAVHRKAVKALQRRVLAESVVVNSSVVGRGRQAAVAQFQQDRRTRVFIGNIRAAGVGITLTAASTVAFAELDWVPANHTQAEDRIHRIGQTDRSWIWYLVASGTIEERLCETLEQKQAVISGTLDGGRVAEDLDIYSQLIEELRGEER